VPRRTAAADEPQPIDLALLCVGGASEEPIRNKFPRDIVTALTPLYVMGGHWEDLFHPRVLPLPGPPPVTEKIKRAPGARLNEFISEAYDALPHGGRVTVPCWEDVAYFKKDSHGTWILDTDIGSPTIGSWSNPKP
jgi:hypothetical protein